MGEDDDVGLEGVHQATNQGRGEPSQAATPTKGVDQSGRVAQRTRGPRNGRLRPASLARPNHDDTHAIQSRVTAGRDSTGTPNVRSRG